MISPTALQIAVGYGRARTAGATARLVAVVAEPAGAASRPAPRPAPRRVAADLEALACDGVRLRDVAAARAALAAFTAGDGYLPGQIIDRAI
ncbi:hypothetical protein [Amaricoccus sp.]|uniref:hypothetical protein n=1 Tax=Amaricoccus sp. TaxID=1872485 RepID=UPI001B615FA8|nr:hypothetical protein [Amaricoccus sp.]MBP7241678.1 hypothetical protein [Amaricoccus sp.]